jgi:hypothetical protein
MQRFAPGQVPEREIVLDMATKIVVAEALLIALLAVLLSGLLGSSPAISAGVGVALMAALFVASVAAIFWARARSDAAFLAAALGAILVKAVVVGLAVAWVWLRTDLPRNPFVWGLMATWLLGFAVQTLLLRAPRKSAGMAS